jgi:DNA primase
LNPEASLGLIPAETLENIRTRLDIVELVSEYVPGLQKAGRNMKGRCPFHQERTPSFIVSAERQTYHCFGCGEGGDAFKFVMKLENLSFTDAVEKLAARAGVKIETQEELGPEAKERLKLKELLAYAADWYNERLKNSPDADAARRYLSSRKVSPASVAAWRLGYSPRSSAFVEAAAKKGWTKDQLIKAGLAAPSKQQAGTLRDYFYDRLMFPIFDAKGAVIAFGGRTLGDGEPKYLNSPETPLFSKSRVLYGLSHGAPTIRKSRRAMLMEGYMDVIAAHQHGLSTACAPLGTALTQDHVALLARYATEVFIVFDADNAGLNAAVRGAELLLAKGFGVRIVTVVDGKDPDELLHEKGVPAFEACLKVAVDLVEFKTELLVSRQEQPLTSEAKSAIAKDVLATIEQCPDEILKSEWLRRLAGRLNVPVSAISKQGQIVNSANSRRAHYGEQAESPKPVAGAVIAGPDEELLLHLFKQPNLSVMPTEEDFISAPAKHIWKALRALEPWPADWSHKLMEAVGSAEKTALQRMLLKADEMSKDEIELRVRRAVEKGRRERRYNELRQLLRENKAVDAKITEEFIRLTAEMKGSAVKA